MKQPKELLKEYLEKKEIELTKEISSIFNKVFTIHDHFTAQDLNEKLVDTPLKNINNALNLLVQSGLIRPFYFGEKPIYYEHIYGHTHHDHLFCVHCGNIIEFKDKIIEYHQNKIAKENNYEVIRHSLQIIGVCPKCQEHFKKKHILAKEITEVKEKVFPLSMASNGEVVTVTDITGGEGLRRRLTSMGLRIGDNLTIINNTFGGPLIIKVGNTRMALGHSMTHKIIVKKK